MPGWGGSPSRLLVLCLCYLHFAPENPEDGEMYLLVPAHLGCPGQSPQSRKMDVCVCVRVCDFMQPSASVGYNLVTVGCRNCIGLIPSFNRDISESQPVRLVCMNLPHGVS